MSLDDKFNPNDGSLIDRVDNVMIGFNKRIGNIWQNKTHKSVDSLKKGLYGTSAITLAMHCAMSSSYIMMLPSLGNATLAVIGGGACPKTSLESEIQFEAIGLPAKSGKYMNIILYGLGAISTLATTTQMVVGAISGNQDLMISGLEGISYGLGVLSWATANYLHQTNFDSPPSKRKKKTVLEKMKEKVGGFLPEPKPEPVPFQMYS